MSNSKTFTPTPPPFDLKPEFEELVPPIETGSEITATDLLKMNITEIPCLVSPILQRIGLACLAGSSDTGKSIFLRQLAMAICAESHFLGYQINAIHRSVIYVSTEDLKQETAFFMQRQANKYRHEPERLNRLRFLFDPENVLELLDARLTSRPADAVILDCFSDIYGSDLKDTQKIRAALKPFFSLADKHQCLFLFLHHTGKRTEYLEPSKNNLLSGQGFEGKMRLVLELRPDNTLPDIKHLCIVKGNYLPSTFKNESIVLSFDKDTFCYSDTGNRVSLCELAKPTDKETKDRQKFEQAERLKMEGFSYDAIAEKIGYSSKSSVSALFDKAKKNGW